MKTLVNQNVVVDILVNNKPIKQYNHQGNIFIESKDGTEYDISITNNNFFRIEATVGVDGIDVISGDAFTEKTTGYIVDKFSTIKIKGYRISDEAVSAFKFCKKDNTYAKEKTDNPQNGVITITCYSERNILNTYNNNWQKIELDQPWKPYNEPWSGTPWKPYNSPTIIPTWYNSNNITCSVKHYNNDNTTPSDHFTMGTTFGKQKDDKIVEVSFERGSDLGTLNIFYSERDQLKEIGVNIINVKEVVLPIGKRKYCSPPKDWKS